MPLSLTSDKIESQQDIDSEKVLLDLRINSSILFLTIELKTA